MTDMYHAGGNKVFDADLNGARREVNNEGGHRVPLFKFRWPRMAITERKRYK